MDLLKKLEFAGILGALLVGCNGKSNVTSNWESLVKQKVETTSGYISNINRIKLPMQYTILPSDTNNLDVGKVVSPSDYPKNSIRTNIETLTLVYIRDMNDGKMRHLIYPADFPFPRGAVAILNYRPLPTGSIASSELIGRVRPIDVLDSNLRVIHGEGVICSYDLPKTQREK